MAGEGGVGKEGGELRGISRDELERDLARLYDGMCRLPEKERGEVWDEGSGGSPSVDGLPRGRLD